MPLRTLQDVLAGLERWPGEPAIVAFRDGAVETLTYGELNGLARRLAAGLIARGLAAGEPVGIYADNRPEAAVLRLALIAAGALMVGIDQDLRPDQLAHVVADSGCRRIFTLSVDLPRVRQACGETLDVFLLDDEANEAGSAESWKSLLAEPSSEFPAASQTAETSQINCNSNSPFIQKYPFAGYENPFSRQFRRSQSPLLCETPGT